MTTNFNGKTVIVNCMCAGNYHSQVSLFHTDVCLPDEAGNVDINKCCHEVLAVESVHYATMTRDSVGKILKGQLTEVQNVLYVIKHNMQYIRVLTVCM